MSNLWRSIDIDWEGKTLTVALSLDLLARIERQGDLSVIKTVNDAMRGAPQYGNLSLVMKMILEAAGAKRVDQERLCAALMGADKGEASKLFLALADAVIPVPFEGNEKGDQAA